MRILFVIFTVMFIAACDGGLAPRPEAEKSFLNGTIRFSKGVENWPDSVFGIRAAAFKQMPDSNIILAILSGNAYVSGELLPLYTDSLNFSLDIVDAPVKLVYIVAVWQYTTDIMTQRVIGVYTLSGDKKEHSELNIEKGESYDINIDVDFDDLPPMPF